MSMYKLRLEEKKNMIEKAEKIRKAIEGKNLEEALNYAEEIRKDGSINTFLLSLELVKTFDISQNFIPRASLKTIVLNLYLIYENFPKEKAAQIIRSLPSLLNINPETLKTRIAIYKYLTEALGESDESLKIARRIFSPSSYKKVTNNLVKTFLEFYGENCEYRKKEDSNCYNIAYGKLEELSKRKNMDKSSISSIFEELKSLYSSGSYCNNCVYKNVECPPKSPTSRINELAERKAKTFIERFRALERENLLCIVTIKEAAKTFGVNPLTLLYRLKKYHLDERYEKIPTGRRCEEGRNIRGIYIHKDALPYIAEEIIFCLTQIAKKHQSNFVVVTSEEIVKKVGEKKNIRINVNPHTYGLIDNIIDRILPPHTDIEGVNLHHAFKKKEIEEWEKSLKLKPNVEEMKFLTKLLFSK